MLIYFIVVIISQYIRVSSQHDVHLNSHSVKYQLCLNAAWWGVGGWRDCLSLQESLSIFLHPALSSMKQIH